MNEIVAFLFWIYESCEEYEVFFLFVKVMAILKEGFLKSYDDYSTGIYYKINQFEELLKALFPKVHSHLEQLSINPIYYSLRWLMLIFTQDFCLPDLPPIWDTFLCHPQRDRYLLFMALGFISYLQPLILAAEFADCLRML